MKKLTCALLAIALMLLMAAMAETRTYEDPDGEIAFDYDTDEFDIAMDDEGDDEHLIILAGTQQDWGEYSIRFHLRDLEEGEAAPTLADFAEIEAALDTEVTQGEWNGFEDAFYYDVSSEEDYEMVFVVPLYDEGGEADELLTINVAVSALDDEEIGMARDDAISAVLDTLEVLDD